MSSVFVYIILFLIQRANISLTIKTNSVSDQKKFLGYVQISVARYLIDKKRKSHERNNDNEISKRTGLGNCANFETHRDEGTHKKKTEMNTLSFGWNV